MKKYELSVLSHKDADQMQLKHDILTQINRVGGYTTHSEADGVKRLAYSICGEESAYYAYYDIELPDNAPQELSSYLNVKDNVLRYLLVRVDERRQTRATTTRRPSNYNLNGSWE